MPLHRHPLAVPIFLTLASGSLILRLFLFIRRYSVNLLYYDAWDYYNPIFQNQGIWQLFSWQENIKRGGLGFIVTATLAKLTGWNTRADAFAVGAIICLAMLLALMLKYRLYGGFTFFDVIIPLLFLTLLQYEIFVVVPTLHVAAFPLLLIVAYCLGLGVQRPWLRYVLLLTLNFLLVYTGHGMFMGPITLVLLAVDTWQTRHNHRPVSLPAAAFVLASATILSFFISYRVDRATRQLGFAVSNLPRYPLYVGLMWAGFWGRYTSAWGQLISSIVGTVLLVAAIAILVYHAQRLARQGIYSNQTSLVIAVLIAFSLLICFSTAIGRMQFGMYSSQASRYVTELIPGYLGMYFHLITHPARRVRQLAPPVFLAACIVFLLPTGVVQISALRNYENQTHWKQCYLRIEKVEKCNQLHDWNIYPIGSIADKLKYLKNHRLNLYLDAGK